MSTQNNVNNKTAGQQTNNAAGAAATTSQTNNAAGAAAAGAPSEYAAQLMRMYAEAEATAQERQGRSEGVDVGPLIDTSTKEQLTTAEKHLARAVTFVRDLVTEVPNQAGEVTFWTVTAARR